MGNTIKILKVEVGKQPYQKEIENELASLQAEVGGLIEVICTDQDCLVVCNEEGKLNGMAPNRRLADDIICGPFFICGDTEDGDFSSLTKEQVEFFQSKFDDAPIFTGIEQELEPRCTVIGFRY